MSLIPDHASKGYFVVPDTSANLKNFYGFTVLAATAISEILPPTSTVAGGPEGYDGDEAGVAAVTSFPPGYYPIRGSSITSATANAIILWLE